MPEIVKNFTCKLYADDSKIIAEIKNEQDSIKLQQDINAIVKWTDTWFMRLNYEKCKVMHFGYKNPKYNYIMHDQLTSNQHTLVATDSERDLGVTLTSDAKWSTHANNCASKANRMLGWMKSSFMCRDQNLWKTLYMTYIRPHLEFAAPAWNVHQKQDIDCIERIQRRATKVSHNLKQFSYQERIDLLGLTTLEARRARGDCIQTFKIMTGRDVVKWHTEPRIAEAAYGHRQRLMRQYVNNCAARHNFFTNRVACQWNKLPDAIAGSSSVNMFKNGFDQNQHNKKTFFIL
jgi:ribonuclease P/MRP protein subunit RPP40